MLIKLRSARKLTSMPWRYALAVSVCLFVACLMTAIIPVTRSANPAAGTYRAAAFPFSPVVGSDGNSYAATADLLPQPPSGSAPAGTANVGYTNFACPEGQSCTADFGEPSIGVNWKTGNVMFAGGGFP